MGYTERENETQPTSPPLDMDTQTSTHMTIKEAALHYGVSDKTIRRRIKTGRLSAQQINGR